MSKRQGKKYFYLIIAFIIFGFWVPAIFLFLSDTPRSDDLHIDTGYIGYEASGRSVHTTLKSGGVIIKFSCASSGNSACMAWSNENKVKYSGKHAVLKWYWRRTNFFIKQRFIVMAEINGESVLNRNDAISNLRQARIVGVIFSVFWILALYFYWIKYVRGAEK